MRSNLASQCRVPKLSTSERTSAQRDTKNCSSSRISATNFFSSWRSFAFALIRLAFAAELDPEYSAASISIIFFGLIYSMEILKIGIKKRTGTEHFFISSERKYLLLLLLPLSSFITFAGGPTISSVLNFKFQMEVKPLIQIPIPRAFPVTCIIK